VSYNISLSSFGSYVSQCITFFKIDQRKNSVVVGSIFLQSSAPRRFFKSATFYAVSVAVSTSIADVIVPHFDTL